MDFKFDWLEEAQYTASGVHTPAGMRMFFFRVLLNVRSNDHLLTLSVDPRMWQPLPENGLSGHLSHSIDEIKKKKAIVSMDYGPGTKLSDLRPRSVIQEQTVPRQEQFQANTN